MLDDEQRVLIEMEDHLRMADPAFVARMSAGAGSLPDLTILAILWLATAPLITLLLGPAGVALTTTIVLAVTVAIRLRRRRRGTGRGPVRAT